MLRSSRIVPMWLLCATAAAALSACGSPDTATSPAVTIDTPTSAGTLAVGASTTLNAGPALTLTSGPSGDEFVLVVTDTAVDGRATANSFQLGATNITAAGSVSAPATSIFAAAAGLSPNYAFSADLNRRAQQVLLPRVAGARHLYAARSAGSALDRTALPAAAVQVGDLVTLNVSNDACDTIVPRAARVVAIGSTSIVVADTLNPAGGFTTADYQRFAARFDTLVYPIDVGNFGAPAALGPEGKILLFFTVAVNALTPRNSTSYVGGFFFDRDQFPVTSTVDGGACKGSNARNLFYLLSPDPGGMINGNVRRTGFVDSVTTSVLAHEFQHLINSSRRLYVNASAAGFEVVWLNEGLSHVAEELLFLHEGKSGPRQNVDVTALRASTALKDAFNADQSANASRYNEYLVAPSTNSPIRNDDSLATRGATWDFLRYAADRKVRTSGGTDASLWFALVNSQTNGIANLRGVFGANVGAMLRDWSVSQYADDVVAGVSADLTQPSWNWHSIFPALSSTSAYPLVVSSLSASGSNGTVIPGGARFYRFAVPANTSATLTLTATGGVIQGTVVRVR
ncbi:MAG: Peptidase hyicolysin [Gemmatimonadetes bacterium]|nr:Peptidase hyicolysin [Gemmatimonadota bacterium]